MKKTLQKMMVAIAACGAVCGTATADPFGIRLGEAVELRERRGKLLAANTPLPLDAPFFGITQATASRPSGLGTDAQVRCQFTISDAFRRGLQRKESLAKINELRGGVDISPLQPWRIT